MRDYAISITAGDSVELREKGLYAKIIDADGTIAMETDNQRVRLATVGKGQGFKGIPYKSLVLKNTGATTVTLVIALDEIDGGELLDAVSIAAGQQIAETPCTAWYPLTKSASPVISATTTPTLADALPTGTRHVIVKTSHANTDIVYVCGIPLDAGEVLPLNLGAGALIQYASASGTQTLYGVCLID